VSKNLAHYHGPEERHSEDPDRSRTYFEILETRAKFRKLVTDDGATLRHSQVEVGTESSFFLYNTTTTMTIDDDDNDDTQQVYLLESYLP
jgi:hypothetical protein